MSYLAFKDYEDPTTGKIDWKAYNAAEVQAGQKCTCCGGLIYPGKGHPSRCADCENLDADPELNHDSRVRCPKCRNHWAPSENEEYKLAYEDGEHEVTCDNCGHEFTVTTHVSYSYTSPAMIQDDPEPEAEEPDDGAWACGTGGPDC